MRYEFSPDWAMNMDCLIRFKQNCDNGLEKPSEDAKRTAR
jgi:hypothetical protein